LRVNSGAAGFRRSRGRLSCAEPHGQVRTRSGTWIGSGPCRQSPPHRPQQRRAFMALDLGGDRPGLDLGENGFASARLRPRDPSITSAPRSQPVTSYRTLAQRQFYRQLQLPLQGLPFSIAPQFRRSATQWRTHAPPICSTRADLQAWGVSWSLRPA